MYGAPQRSILGLLLFLCYLRGVPQIVKEDTGSVCLYADDTNILISEKSNESVQLTSFVDPATVEELLDQKIC